MKIRIVLLTTFLGVLTGMVMYTPVSMVAGCSHPAQSALRAGQCLLDNGVLSETLAALAQSDYLEQVGLVALKRAGDLVDCALQAIAAQSPATAPPAGSSAARAIAASPDAGTLASRAREVLAALRSAGK